MPDQKQLTVIADHGTYDHLVYYILREASTVLCRLISDGRRTDRIMEQNSGSREMPDTPTYALIIAQVIAAVAAYDGRQKAFYHKQLTLSVIKQRLLLADLPIGLAIQLLTLKSRDFITDQQLMRGEQDNEVGRQRRQLAVAAAFDTVSLSFKYVVSPAMQHALDVIAVAAALSGMTARVIYVEGLGHVQLDAEHGDQRMIVLPTPTRIMLFERPDTTTPTQFSRVVAFNRINLVAITVKAPDPEATDQTIQYPIIYDLLNSNRP